MNPKVRALPVLESATSTLRKKSRFWNILLGAWYVLSATPAVPTYPKPHQQAFGNAARKQALREMTDYWEPRICIEKGCAEARRQGGARGPTWPRVSETSRPRGV